MWAIFTFRDCVSIDQPAAQKSSTLTEFARLQNPEKVILLTLDLKVQIFRAENAPAC